MSLRELFPNLTDENHTTPDDIAGSDYGEVVQFMKRPLDIVENIVT